MKNQLNFKKISSFFLIVFITAILGGIVSYVRAAYVEPAGAPVGNNSPAPILVDATGPFPNGEPGYFKMGKLGVAKDKTNDVDNSQFNAHSLVVMGLLTTDALTSSYQNRIRAELETNSSLYPLFVGNPTNSSFMQMNSNNTSPLTFRVLEHTRVPRMVIGSKSAPGDLYHLYLAEGSNATNLGKSGQYDIYALGSPNNKTSFCTLTDAQLKNSGCPAMTYMGQLFPDPNPSTNGDVVASCHQTTPQSSSSPYSNFNKGSCY